MAWSLDNYERYIYSVQNLSPCIQASTLVLIRYGKSVADVEGTVLFETDLSLEVYEHLNFISDAFILMYGYVIKKDAAVVYRYDSQPHPNDPTLQFTHAHHKHIHSDIKHHRIPAPGLSFSEPNLTFLIREIASEFFANR
ncbi:MAG: DUF6516 family protein [candidate division KSB1 bacterium]|nr:DUF6516 family protein [candidate division KSB1 bacterium]MDZ7368635.1 DUF6516 family protein [candidate division KSB1 bacterium]MDZ7406329.1 DUF6516 family protein [candidate division KSB1 bacterium]